MELETNTNMCRCCATEGTFKDVKTAYQWMGEEEVYSDMLRECFDVCLMETGSGDDGGICEVCITQLRNASNFKKQVLYTESQFKQRLQNKELKGCVVKLEPENAEDSNESDNDVTADYDPDFNIKAESADEPKPKRPKRGTATITLKKTKKSAGETSGKRTDAAAPKSKKRKKEGVSATPERVEHRVNLTNILKFSNASPFRDKTMRGFSCLYCAKAFKDIVDLRAHTALQSEKDKINSMIDYKLSYNPIKVDITDLQCTICSRAMKDLNELKEHLVQAHKKMIHKDIKDIILPFRLENGQNFTCVICSVVHISFKNLYHHMSSHYRNYCCQNCGAGYITIAALRKHGKTHFQGNFPCGYCEKVYTSLTKKRNHEKGVHGNGWLRNKCPHCPEIFVSYYDRSEHLVKVHNEAPVVYACNACNKTYKKKFELNRHIKHHHLQQKSYLCDKCNAKFFSKRGLIDHLSRHAGAELFKCDVCGKTFSRLRTLKEHMKNHEDGNRFQCEVCKKTFMQKNSLKSHVRLHQDDLDIFKEFDDVKHLIDNREMTLKEIAAENRKREQDERSKQLQNQQQQLIEHQPYGGNTDLMPHMNQGETGASKKDTTSIKRDTAYTEIEVGESFSSMSELNEYIKRETTDEEIKGDISENREKHTPEINKQIEKDIVNKIIVVKSVNAGDFLPEIAKQWHNLTTLLKYSNATPFKDKTDAGFTCAYCFKVIPDIDMLRRHSNEDHDKEKVVHKAGGQIGGFVFFLDIFDLKCSLCNSSAKSLKDLAKHLATEHNRKYYFGLTDYFQPYKLTNGLRNKCCLCNESFNSMKALTQHMNMHFRNFMCTTCGAGFVNYNRLKSHETGAHLKKKTTSYPCKLCGQDFPFESTRKAHVLRAHKGVAGDCICRICKARFNNYYQKTRHMRLVHDAQGIKCERCNKQFSATCHYDRHMKTVHQNEWKTGTSDKEKSLITTDTINKDIDASKSVSREKHITETKKHIKRETAYKSAMNKHKKKDTGNKKIVVAKSVNRDDFLPEMTKQWHNLTTLLKYSNATPFKDRTEAGFTCAYCFKAIPDIDMFRRHTNEDHDKEKLIHKAGALIREFVVSLDIVDLKCTLCNTSAETLKELAEHLVTDHNRKYYLGLTDYFQPFKLTNGLQNKCCLCSGSFSSMKALTQHMNVHFRNFICTTCGAGFVNANRLNRHETGSHSEKKTSYPCKFCGQDFPFESTRKAHVLTAHKGVAGDCICRICKARFKNNYQKTRHMTRVHNVEGIKCDRCTKQFSATCHYVAHMKTVHLKERLT